VEILRRESETKRSTRRHSTSNLQHSKCLSAKANSNGLAVVPEDNERGEYEVLKLKSAPRSNNKDTICGELLTHAM
jgi:predicted transcriptional regulator